MQTLHISVADKIATYQRRDGDIICGNSNYQIEFAFDSEWDAYAEKTVRFIINGEYTDVDFKGTTCAVPIVQNAHRIEIGVYAGDLRTTTRAIIECRPSILCGTATPSTENDKNYVNEAKKEADRAEAAANRVTDAADRAESAADRTEELLNDYIIEVDFIIGGGW